MRPSDTLIHATLNRLRGQRCTPSGTNAEAVAYIRANGLAKFDALNVGHWQITKRGRDWLDEHAADFTLQQALAAATA